MAPKLDGLNVQASEVHKFFDRHGRFDACYEGLPAVDNIAVLCMRQCGPRAPTNGSDAHGRTMLHWPSCNP